MLVVPGAEGLRPGVAGGGSPAGKPAGRLLSFVEQTARQDNWQGGPQEEDGLPLVVINNFGDFFYRSERVIWDKPNLLTPSDFFITYAHQSVAPAVNYPPKIMEIGDFGGSPKYDFFVAYGDDGNGAFGIYDESGNIVVEEWAFANNGSINDAFIYACDNDADLDIILAGSYGSGGDFVWYSRTEDYAFTRVDFNDDGLSMEGPSGVLAGNFFGSSTSVVGCDGPKGSIYLFNYNGSTFEYAYTIVDGGFFGCGPMAAADFNDDGALDFVCGSTSGGPLSWFENLAGGFVRHDIIDYVEVSDVCTGYVNDDDNPDVIAINGAGNIVWWEWTGTGSGFGSAKVIDDSGVFGPGSTLAVGDIDSGIRFEVCAASRNGGSLWSYFTEDGVDFQRVEVVAGYSTPSDVIIADRDDDTFGDILTCSYDDKK